MDVISNVQEALSGDTIASDDNHEKRTTNFQAPNNATRPHRVGEVRIHFNPGPDAQERLKGAFRIILAAAMRNASVDAGGNAAETNSSTGESD